MVKTIDRDQSRFRKIVGGKIRENLRRYVNNEPFLYVCDIDKILLIIFLDY